MSEDFAPQTDVEPVVEDGSPSSSEVSQDTEIPVLDVGEYGDYRIPVKMDGEELQVPLSEAISGYQRQADYTRKTQELAQQREQLAFAANLQSALENDPAATIDLLSRHYGISRAEARDMVDDFSSDYEEIDPTEKKMRELDQRIAQFEEYQSQQQIEKEISRLQSKYDDFETNEVISAALRSNTTDLEAVYKQIAFDKFMKQKELDKLAFEQQQLKESKVVEAKREASVVSGGSSATSNTTAESYDSVGSISDAWAAAKRQLNANF